MKALKEIRSEMEATKDLYICEECGREYKLYESDAQQKDKFCCLACEWGY